MSFYDFIKSLLPKGTSMSIYDLIKSINPSLLIEIGSNVGSDTERFKSLAPNAKIIGFEPDPRNLAVLKSRGISKFATIEPYAISNVTGKQTFYLSSGEYSGVKDWSYSSSLKKPTEHLNVWPSITFDQKIEVDALRLDDYPGIQNQTIDFIWMDVQGAEELVFSGASKTLKRTKWIYTEFSNRPLYENQKSLDQLMDLLGKSWLIHTIYESDVLLKNITF
jgi:FkbM family methyltransferase